MKFLKKLAQNHNSIISGVKVVTDFITNVDEIKEKRFTVRMKKENADKIIFPPFFCVMMMVVRALVCSTPLGWLHDFPCLERED